MENSEKGTTGDLQRASTCLKDVKNGDINKYFNSVSTLYGSQAQMELIHLADSDPGLIPLVRAMMMNYSPECMPDGDVWGCLSDILPELFNELR